MMREADWYFWSFAPVIVVADPDGILALGIPTLMPLCMN